MGGFLRMADLVAMAYDIRKFFGMACMFVCVGASIGGADCDEAIVEAVDFLTLVRCKERERGKVQGCRSPRGRMEEKNS